LPERGDLRLWNDLPSRVLRMSWVRLMGRGLCALGVFAAVCGLLAGEGGCGSTSVSPSGTAGSGGGTAGTTGLAGMGGGGGSDLNSCGAGTSGVTGTGGDVVGPAGTPQEVHDALLNAPTFGGLDVTRTPPTITYPVCQ
jgi:hypothetical protein